MVVFQKRVEEVVGSIGSKKWVEVVAR